MHFNKSILAGIWSCADDLVEKSWLSQTCHHRITFEDTEHWVYFLEEFISNDFIGSYRKLHSFSHSFIRCIRLHNDIFAIKGSFHSVSSIIQSKRRSARIRRRRCRMFLVNWKIKLTNSVSSAIAEITSFRITNPIRFRAKYWLERHTMTFEWHFTTLATSATPRLYSAIHRPHTFETLKSNNIILSLSISFHRLNAVAWEMRREKERGRREDWTEEWSDEIEIQHHADGQFEVKLQSKRTQKKTHSIVHRTADSSALRYIRSTLWLQIKFISLGNMLKN